MKKLNIKLDYLEIWTDIEFNEWSIFSPNDYPDKKSIKNLTHTLYGKPMKLVASLLGTYEDAKDIYINLSKDYDNAEFDFLKK
jgi:hypothetical protein